MRLLRQLTLSLVQPKSIFPIFHRNNKVSVAQLISLVILVLCSPQRLLTSGVVLYLLWSPTYIYGGFF